MVMQIKIIDVVVVGEPSQPVSNFTILTFLGVVTRLAGVRFLIHQINNNNRKPLN